MNYYTFEYPYMILLLFPIIYCLYKCKENIKSVYFVHLHLISPKKVIFRVELFVKILIFVLLCVALASFVVIDTNNSFNRNGRGIVIALDGSGSMNSSGFDEENLFGNSKHLSRFELTKLVAKDFIKKRYMDNIGIVMYGDFAFIASALTYEKDIIIEMLEYLNQGMAGQNTAIGEAIAISVRAFKYSKAKSKIIILLSDGGQNSGAVSIKDSIEMAKKVGIKIYTISVGNDSAQDKALLEKIAKESRGEFFSAKSAKELQKVYDRIDALEASKIKDGIYLSMKYYYDIFLLFAISLLLYLLYLEVKK